MSYFVLVETSNTPEICISGVPDLHDEITHYLDVKTFCSLLQVSHHMPFKHDRYWKENVSSKFGSHQPTEVRIFEIDDDDAFETLEPISYASMKPEGITYYEQYRDLCINARIISLITSNEQSLITIPIR